MQTTARYVNNLAPKPMPLKCSVAFTFFHPRGSPGTIPRSYGSVFLVLGGYLLQHIRCE